MIISRSIVLLVLSAGLLPVAADLRIGRRHLQGTELESNATDDSGGIEADPNNYYRLICKKNAADLWPGV